MKEIEIKIIIAINKYGECYTYSKSGKFDFKIKLKVKVLVV